MIVPDQRAVSVKKTGFSPCLNARPFACRTLALFLSIALIRPAFAAEPLKSDRPTAERMESGLLLSPAAEKKLDDELKRLQAIEAEHRSESWVKVVLVSAAVGLLVGAATGASVALAVAPKKP